MGFEKKFVVLKSRADQLPDQDLILNQQLDEAIKEEDFEQAGVLRDFIKLRKDKGTDSEITMYDLLDLGDEHGYVSSDDPKYRAWLGIDSKRDESRFKGKDVVDNSKLASYFNEGESQIVDLERDLDLKIRDLSEKEERIDLISNLYGKREEAEKIKYLAKEKLDQVWQPYREQLGLFNKEYEEFNSSYNELPLTSEQKRNLDNVPSSINEPAAYWQKVYDNSRFLLDVLNDAIGQLKQ